LSAIEEQQVRLSLIAREPIPADLAEKAIAELDYLRMLLGLKEPRSQCGKS